MKSNIHKTISILAVLCILLIYPATSDALSWIFTKIVDTYTIIPGQKVKFTCFGQPSLDGKNVAFWGKHRHGDRSEFSGIYTYIDGTLNVIADNDTPIPDGIGNFTHFSDFSFDGKHVAFVGSGSDLRRGIYTDIGGTLHMLAGKNTPVPDSSGNSIAFFSGVSIDRGSVAFNGTDNNIQGGIYTNIGGMLRVVADTTTPVPGGTPPEKFIDVAEAIIDGGKIAFTGYGSASSKGIYIVSNRTLHIVTGKDTPVAGKKTWNISDLWVPSLDGENVAFKASINNGISIPEAICTVIGGTVRVVAMQGYTPVPEGIGNFTVFGDPSMDRGSVAFHGFGNYGQQGIYTEIGGILTAVIDTNTLLDGKHPRAFLFKRDEGLSRTSVAFSVRFEDDTQAIYRADLDSNGDGLSDKVKVSLGTVPFDHTQIMMDYMTHLSLIQEQIMCEF